MIVRDKPSALHLLFAVRGSVLPHIAPALLVMISLSVALVLWDRHVGALPHLNSQPFAMFGVALSLFLGFRNNAAYDRWWEARKLWGALLIEPYSDRPETSGLRHGGCVVGRTTPGYSLLS